MLEFLAAIERHLLTIRRLLAGSTSVTDEQLRAIPIDVNMVSGTVTIGSEIEITNDAGNPIPVSIATLPLATDAATETTLSTLLKSADTLNKVTTLDTITNQVTVNVGLTDVELRATPVPVSVTGGGDASAANQTTIIGHLDGVEGLLTTIDADTGSMATDLTTLTAVDYATQTTLATLLKPADTLTAVTTVGTITNVVHVDDNAGSITVDGPLTDTELRAVPVPISGTITSSAQPGVDIGDVTINNAAGASAVNIQDGGNSITVDGTVTANLGTIAGISTEAKQDTQITNQGTINTSIGTVNTSVNTLLKPADTLTAVTTVGTITNVVHVDDNAGSLTVDGTITANAGTNLNTSALALEATLQSVKTAVEVIDNAISGNEMQVDVLTLPTIPPDLSSIAYDAGGRHRVSQLTTLGDYKILNVDRTLLVETAGNGTGSFTNNTYTMTVTNGQYLIRQSKKYHPYLSGKSQIAEFTFENFHTQANVIKRIGYFSSNAAAPYDTTYDGIYLENDGTDMRFRVTKAGTTVLNVTQANWNGNILAGHEWKKFNAVLFDFLWLGGAVLRLYVRTTAGFTLCHTYVHAANAAGTMTLSPNQPVRYEIRGNGAGGTMTSICSQVSTEGTLAEAGLLYGITHGTTGITLTSIGTTYPILAVRKKSTQRDVALELVNYKLLTASANDQLKLWLLLNPTTSSALSYSSGPGSMEYAFGNGTITVIGFGTVLNVGFSTQVSLMETQTLIDNFLTFLGSTLDNTMDTIVLAGTPITSTIVTHSSLTVKEY